MEKTIMIYNVIFYFDEFEIATLVEVNETDLDEDSLSQLAATKLKVMGFHFCIDDANGIDVQAMC